MGYLKSNEAAERCEDEAREWIRDNAGAIGATELVACASSAISPRSNGAFFNPLIAECHLAAMRAAQQSGRSVTVILPDDQMTYTPTTRPN